MASTITAAAAGGTALAAYLDARLHIRNDLREGSDFLNKALLFLYLNKRQKAGKMYLYHILEERVGTAMGEHIFLMFEGRQWTYTQFFHALQPIGNWLRNDLGVQPGEIVGLNGGNSAEYLLVWFALEAVGACPAFINSHLTAQPLVHCVKIAKARYLLADADVRPLVAPVEEELRASGSQTIYYTPELLASFGDTTLLPASCRPPVGFMDVAGLIYTSGTTGMPKATVMPRARELAVTVRGPALRLGLKPGDRMYTCLPLYHGAAHGLCVAPCLGAGATVVLARKFSHSTFWPDVHASRADVIQYVGELCRYLINAPPSPLDRGHGVRIAWGNGMRLDVWEPFRERFGIETIAELYAATDGMGGFVNVNRGDFTRGALALRGPLWHLLNGRDQRRVVVDPDTQDVVRGRDGFAIEAKRDEPGENLHRMDTQDPDTGTPTYYQNHGAALKRRIRDVFRKGDLWYRSGDLMRLDAEGRLFFVDRLGDTFRWHSENVSTNEVGDVVGDFPQVAECNVYGVLVPNADGRAGCAAVVLRDGLAPDGVDWSGLARHNLARLPRYAVPIFVRVVRQLEYTGTMKMQKGRLRAEGIELDDVERAAAERGEPADLVYWLPPGCAEYVPFRRKDLDELKGAKVRL